MVSELVWKERPSGIDWSYWDYGKHTIEPEDLNCDHWLAPNDFEGTFSRCKAYVEGLGQ